MKYFLSLMALFAFFSVMFFHCDQLDPETTNRFDTPPILTQHYADTTVRQHDTVNLAVSARDSNPDGSIVLYLLDRGCNGWDDSSGGATTFRIANPAGGALKVACGVRDNEGVVAADTFTITFNREPAGFVMNSPRDSAAWSSCDVQRGTGSVTFSFFATDSDGDSLTYSLLIGKESANLLPAYDGRATLYTMYSLDTVKRYYWRLNATDPLGQTSSITGTFKTGKISLIAHTISNPVTPSGPQSGQPGVQHNFTVTAVNCSYNHAAFYFFDWGDRTTSGWINQGNSTKSWPNFGIYTIRTKARCPIDTQIISAFSPPFQVGILTLPGTTNVTLLDDCEGGTSANRFGYWWYFFDDSANYKGPNSKITNSSKDASLYYIVKPTSLEGNKGTTCIRMDYRLGPGKINCGTGCAYAFIGAGTLLAADGNVCDITGATKIKFYARSNPSVTLSIDVATSDVTDYNYYRTIITIGTSWQQYTIALTPGAGITQQNWGIKVSFNPQHVTRIQWTVHTDQIPGATLPLFGTVWFDDITIEGYTWKPH